MGNIASLDFILNKLIILPGVLIAIILHEIAHGYSAYILGDPTAKRCGRLTLNPLAHIDLLGFLFLLIFRFGWAKPVPVNPNNFKNRKRDNIIVSLAGSMTNFIIAIVFSIILALEIRLGLDNIFIEIVVTIIQINLTFGMFNLLPFPPLDGSKVIASLLPLKYELKFYEYEKYLYFLLIVLLLSNKLNPVLFKLVNIPYKMLINLVDILINI